MKIGIDCAFQPSDRLFIVKDEVHDPPANDCLSRTQFSVPLEVKKLCVCHNTGETVLHKAARLGYKVTFYDL